jgi:hypothetical protein
MYTLNSTNNIYRSDLLPPTNVPKKVKESEKWQKAMLDSLEHIAKTQFVENLKFYDYYRMIENKMSYQELKDVIPYLEGIQDLLNGVEIPTFLKHYDIIGSLVRDIVGRYRDLQDKFHVIDVGDIAENELQRHKMMEIIKGLDKVIDEQVSEYMVKNGLTPEGREFSSPEEQQQFMQQLEAEKQKAVPEHLARAKQQSFKTIGIQWAEVTLAKDTIEKRLDNLDADNLRDKTLTGRCFRHFTIHPNGYDIENWSPKNTFHAKEVSTKYAQESEYVGRLHVETPAGVIKKFGHMIDTKTQQKMLGGNQDWRNFVTEGFFSAPIDKALASGFSKPARAPFSGSLEYNFYLGLQDQLGMPLGEYHEYQQDGSTKTYDTFLPRLDRNVPATAKFYANILRSDFEHRNDLCEIVEAYVRCYDLYGFLTYEDEEGNLITEEVTEDILPDLLKEKGIKQIKNQTLVDVIREAPEVDTIVWVYRPVAYEGVKIICPNLQEPLYLYFRKCEHQIKGVHMFDTLLPVSGYIGVGVAERIMPFQVAYNLVMNQIFNMLEKEIGVLFLMDVTLIPSDIAGWGDSAEALVSMRNIAKEIGIMPVQTSGDGDKNQNHFNQFSAHNLSYQGQIQYRLQLAEVYKRLAYEQIGSNPQLAVQPTKYETAEGVRVSQEISLAQLSEIYEEFSEYKQRTLEMHLSVAQYAQSNNLDFTVTFTRDDATMGYLRVNDPNLPLRTLGILPSKNNSKRKELEAFKQYILSNTNQAPAYEVAKLMSSDAMSEAIEIATQLYREQMEREQMRGQQQMEAMQQDAAIKEQQEAKKFERDMIRLEKEGEIKINVEGVKAKGRAADNQADAEGYRQIEKSQAQALKQQELSSKEAIAEAKMETEKSKQDFEREMRMKEFNLEVQKLKEKIDSKNKDVQIALVNKN